ncbi:MAG: hypothetical protein J3R72DRAFT_441133 [Linnemannia gamsii]|nr:MAG: hypothetical protein J3R72DRAFT_441133 [Linnemannia gamsii]
MHSTSTYSNNRASRMLISVASLFLITITTLSSLHTAHAQKAPGPRAGHCIVEHNGVVYVLGGTPPVSSAYANFTSLQLPQNNIWDVQPDDFPWTALAPPPVSIHIPALTMTYNSQTPTVTPSWTDCFATGDGRIVVVGGSAQLLVYDIASAAWSQPAGSIKFGPSVSSGMFLNPVYIQSRILGDGTTGLVVCTLTWNSQPQPYYLDTKTWTVTLAIGTVLTTPASAPGSSNGWGVVPGNGPLLPPNGFRHFTLVVLGNTAYIMGGYSTLLTGEVRDWSSITSFPVLQAPSSTMIMFGNAGNLASTTRGSVAYSISETTVHILPGNKGGNGQSLQLVQTFSSNIVTATTLELAISGPKNSIFRGSTLIGKGGNQIFVHGGLRTLDFGSPSVGVPSLDYFESSAAVWNGDSQTWGNMASIYVPPKSNGLMIGLIAGGGVVLLILIGVGIWFYKRRQRHRILEEEERQAKGMVLKNEDNLQKEHKNFRSFDENSSARPTPAIAYYVAPPGGNNGVGHGGEMTGSYLALHPSTHGYAEGYATGRGTSSEAIRASTYTDFGPASSSPYAQPQPELIDEEYVVQTSDGSPRYPNSPQDYSSLGHDNMDSTTSPALNNDGLISRAPSRYQSVVSTTGHPIFGMSADLISKREYDDANSQQHGQTQVQAPYHPSTPSDNGGGSGPYVLPNPAAQRSEPYFVRPYSQASTSNLSPSPLLPRSQHTPVSPTFSAAYSMPESAHGGSSSDGGAGTAGGSVIPLLPPSQSANEFQDPQIAGAYAQYQQQQQQQQQGLPVMNNQTRPQF